MFEIQPVFSVASRRFNVIILAAGLGTRLRPATDHIPKALVAVGQQRAIDHLLGKYQYIAERFVIATGFCADLLENYVRGRYPSLRIAFSREAVDALSGPGTSLLLALDHASSLSPTLLTFCDYLIGDAFPVDEDALGLCATNDPLAVLGSYKTVAVIEESVVTDLIANPDEAHQREHGFTGIAICHDTLRLKAITYGAAVERGVAGVDFAFDIIRPYLLQVRTRAVHLSRMLEFGTEETLAQTRARLANSLPPR